VDVLDGDSLERSVREERADFVINCIGVVKQHQLASDKFASAAINAWLPHRLAKLCSETGGRLIHVSTDCVFDGVRGRYTEADAFDATDLYGLSKWLGETDAGETAALTLRTSIIGRELKPPTHGLVEWFLAQDGRSIKGFARAIYTGLTTIELARVMALVVERHPRLSGLYQVASNPITKFDLLTLIAQMYGMSVQIERDEKFVCDRSLVMKPFTEQTGYVAPDWPAMVAEMRADRTPYAASSPSA